MYTVPVSFLL